MLTQPETATDVRSIYDQVQREFACGHPGEDVILTRFTKINGTVEYRRQCLTCGDSLGAVKRATIPPAERDRLPEFDRSIVERQRQAWRARYDELRKAREDAIRDERQEWYRDYLRTPEWSRKRRLVLERDNWLCQGCRQARAVEVHHLTYAHIGNEYLFELVSVCSECHRGIHGTEPS